MSPLTMVRPDAAEPLDGHILAALSHDLRAPLAAIKASATALLCDELELDVRGARDLAETIDQETDRLTRMVQHLLDLRRVETGSATPSLLPTDVEDLVSATVEGLGPAASRSPWRISS